MDSNGLCKVPRGGGDCVGWRGRAAVRAQAVWVQVARAHNRAGCFSSRAGGGAGAFFRQLSVGGGGRVAGWDYCSSYSGNCSAEGRREPGRRRRRSTEADDGGRMRPEDGDAMAPKKRVMAVIDRTTRAKQAMMWALIHVAGKGDLLTIIHAVEVSI
ncbi:hypothetical protein KSP39_PZI006061 [Platanthera zijinensis]|uniref:UspA domain-containing protein n=1 Tax=Platanthera zijinensis TaxID=2320716 RepID=A0AAP0GAS9_9ASPA